MADYDEESASTDSATDTAAQSEPEAADPAPAAGYGEPAPVAGPMDADAGPSPYAGMFDPDSAGDTGSADATAAAANQFGPPLDFPKLTEPKIGDSSPFNKPPLGSPENPIIKIPPFDDPGATWTPPPHISLDPGLNAPRPDLGQGPAPGVPVGDPGPAPAAGKGALDKVGDLNKVTIPGFGTGSIVPKGGPGKGTKDTKQGQDMQQTR